MTQWYEIGLHLGLDETDLSIIEHDNPKDMKACIRKMFSQWLQNDPQPSYKHLLDALVAAGDQKAVHEFCQKYGNKLTILL